MDTVSTARPVLPYSAYSTPSPPPSIAPGRTGGSSMRQNSKKGIINGFNNRNNATVSTNSNNSNYSRSRSNSRRRADSDVTGGEAGALDSVPTVMWATTGRLNSRSSSRASTNNTLGSGNNFLSTLFVKAGASNGNGSVMRKMRNLLTRQKLSSDSPGNNSHSTNNDNNNNNNNYHASYSSSLLSSPTASSSPVSPTPPLPHQHFHTVDTPGNHHYNHLHSEGNKSVPTSIAANSVNANVINIGSAANARSLSPQPLIALGPRQLMAHIALMSNDNEIDSSSSHHSLSSTNSNDSDSLLPTDSSIESHR